MFETDLFVFLVKNIKICFGHHGHDIVFFLEFLKAKSAAVILIDNVFKRIRKRFSLVKQKFLFVF